MKKRLISLLVAITLTLALCPAAGAAETLRPSDALVTFLKNGEGFSAVPYGGPGGWYIGYGCSCDPADYPNGITEAGAEALLRRKLDAHAADVRRFLDSHGIAVTQAQFDALSAMAYAFGPTVLNPANRLPSYLINGIDNYTDQQIASAFAAWCHVGGAVNTAVLERRIMEAKMFLRGDYANSADGWKWLILDPGRGRNALSDVAVYPAGKPYGVLPEATCAGCVLAGWETPSGRLLRATDPVTENLRVTARWTTAAGDAPGAVFPDVPTGVWYEESVKELVAEDVVHGYPDGTFRPDSPVTWGEALTLILRAALFPEQARPEDPDGKPVHWAAGYLDFAEENEFLAPGAVSDLDRAITRSEVADLCAAALELDPPKEDSPFADTSRASVRSLYEAELVFGSEEDGRLLYKGGDRIRRCEICAMLLRITDYVERTILFFRGYRVKIDETLRMTPYDPACFAVKNGRLTYDDGVTVTRCGIDVSTYQNDIDWKAVAADGIDFVIMRCGFRGYGSGEIHEDAKFRQNILGAAAAGLDIGVYFFSQATSVAEAREEAAFTLECIRSAGVEVTYPVVFDWEQITSPGSRTRTYSGAVVTECTVAFCDAVAAAGYTPMTYFNETLAYLKLDLHRLQNYAGWLAWYHDYQDYIYDYQMWQYGTCPVAGISGDVDMNLSFVDFAGT